VSFTLLNLSHREGHGKARPMMPGTPVTVRIPMNATAHSFAQGHRLRLAISTSYWPMAWPSPVPVTLGVRTGSLTLPRRPPSPDDTRVVFEAPEAATAPEATELTSGEARRHLERDIASGAWAYTITQDVDDRGQAAVSRIEEIDLETGHSIVERFFINDDDPLSARVTIEQRILFRRPGWEVRAHVDTELRSTETAFELEGRLEAFEGDRSVFLREWNERLPRDGV